MVSIVIGSIGQAVHLHLIRRVFSIHLTINQSLMVVYQVWDHSHDGSMYYMLTKLGYVDGKCGSIYTIRLDPMGFGAPIFCAFAKDSPVISLGRTLLAGE